MATHASIQSMRREILALVQAGWDEDLIACWGGYTPTQVKEALSHSFLTWRSVLKARRDEAIARMLDVGKTLEASARAHGVSMKTVEKDLAAVAVRANIRQLLPALVDWDGQHLGLTSIRGAHRVKRALCIAHGTPLQGQTPGTTLIEQIRLVLLDLNHTQPGTRQ